MEFDTKIKTVAKPTESEPQGPACPMENDVNIMVVFGQSTSTGAHSVPIISTGDASRNITFSGGPRDPSQDYMCLRETPYGHNAGESPTTSSLQYMTHLANKKGMDIRQMFGINNSSSGASAATMIDYWSTIMEPALKNAQAIVDNNEKYASVKSVCFMHGEADVNNGDYYNDIIRLYNLMGKSVKDINGQTDHPRWFLWCNSNNAFFGSHVQAAFVDLAVRRPYAFDMIGPTYFLGKAQGEPSHLTNIGSYVAGLYAGRCMFQRLVENREPDWIKPLFTKRRGTSVIIQYSVPNPPLKRQSLDYFGVPNTGKVDFLYEGYTVKYSNVDDAHKTKSLVIESVIVHPTSVELVIPGLNPEKAIFVGYASRDLESMTTDIGSCLAGNICDSTDETYTLPFKIEGQDEFKTVPLQHWVPNHHSIVNQGEVNITFAPGIQAEDDPTEEIPPEDREGNTVIRYGEKPVSKKGGHFSTFFTVILFILSLSLYYTGKKKAAIALVFAACAFATISYILYTTPRFFDYSEKKPPVDEPVDPQGCFQLGGNRNGDDKSKWFSGGRVDCMKKKGCEYDEDKFTCYPSDLGVARTDAQIPEIHCQIHTKSMCENEVSDVCKYKEGMCVPKNPAPGDYEFCRSFTEDKCKLDPEAERMGCAWDGVWCRTQADMPEIPDPGKDDEDDKDDKDDKEEVQKPDRGETPVDEDEDPPTDEDEGPADDEDDPAEGGEDSDMSPAEREVRGVKKVRFSIAAKRLDPLKQRKGKCESMSGDRNGDDSGLRDKCYGTTGCSYDDSTFTCFQAPNSLPLEKESYPSYHCQKYTTLVGCGDQTEGVCKWDKKNHMCSPVVPATSQDPNSCSSMSGNKFTNRSGGRVKCFQTDGCNYDDENFMCYPKPASPALPRSSIKKYHCQRIKERDECNGPNRMHWCYYNDELKTCQPR